MNMEFEYTYEDKVGIKKNSQKYQLTRMANPALNKAAMCARWYFWRPKVKIVFMLISEANTENALLFEYKV